MLVQEKYLGFELCDEPRVMSSHIELPITLDSLGVRELFDIDGAGFNASLLIPITNYAIDIRSDVFLHILNSDIERTESYDKKLDSLFKEGKSIEIRAFAEPCKLSPAEKIMVLAKFVPTNCSNF